VKKDREDPGVWHAHAVGAVACGDCRVIHIDMVDVNLNVIATGNITFEQWKIMVDEVADEIAELANGTPKV